MAGRTMRGLDLNRMARWWRLPRSERALLYEAVAQLARARIQTRFAPFPRIAAELHGPVGATPDPRSARACATAVQRAARHLPFRALCFEQALALHAMLHRRAIAARLHYGLAGTGEGKLEGHVWVSCGGEIVLGGETSGQFRELATFPGGALAA